VEKRGVQAGLVFHSFHGGRYLTHKIIFGYKREKDVKRFPTLQGRKGVKRVCNEGEELHVEK